MQKAPQRERNHKHHQRLRAGHQPPGDSQREQPAPALVCGSVMGVMRMVMAVSVTMAVMVMMGMAQGLHPLHQEPDPHYQHEQTACQRQPRKNLCRRQAARRIESHESKSEDACRMRRRHHAAQQDGVRNTALGSRKVGRHDSLAMARSERVRRTQRKSDAQCRDCERGI